MKRTITLTLAALCAVAFLGACEGGRPSGRQIRDATCSGGRAACRALDSWCSSTEEETSGGEDAD